jgi:hypothetical protein
MIIHNFTNFSSNFYKLIIKFFCHNLNFISTFQELKNHDKAHKKYTTQTFSSAFKFIGPLAEKLKSCTIKPHISPDGKFWILKNGEECKEIYCNFKHDGARLKYETVSCNGDTLTLESSFFNGEFTPNFDTESYFCPPGMNSIDKNFDLSLNPPNWLIWRYQN